MFGRGYQASEETKGDYSAGKTDELILGDTLVEGVNRASPKMESKMMDFIDGAKPCRGKTT